MPKTLGKSKRIGRVGQRRPYTYRSLLDFPQPQLPTAAPRTHRHPLAEPGMPRVEQPAGEQLDAVRVVVHEKRAQDILLVPRPALFEPLARIIEVARDIM